MVLGDLPGESCGACGLGAWVCAPDGESLVCDGEVGENACGGCDSLPGAPGDACGVCGDGTYACDGESLVCDGAVGANGCGGCGDLGGEVGAPCDAAGAPGTLRCQDADTLACVDDSLNACGGATSLAEDPGLPCGSCDLGVVVCDGADATRCEGEGEGENACGGCGALEAEPGVSCGDCAGGTYECGAEGVVTCDEPTRNACGGCGDLVGEPGDVCEGGVFVCVDDDVVCDPAASNACGGAAALTGALGGGCGDCGDGLLECAGPDALGCVGASALNGCGSCGALVGVPGEPCGPPGFGWACAADGSLECTVIDPDLVVGLFVEPDPLALVPGGTGDLTATARLADGRTLEVTAMATWSTADDTLATVDATGAVTGVASGSTSVTASHMGLDATVVVRVADVTSLEISPAAPSTPLGVAVMLRATATFDDGTSAEVTTTATWSGSDDATATVDRGLVTPLAVGAVTATASFGGLDATSAVTVTPAEATAITVAPPSTSLASGRTVALMASATFTDGTMSDVTSRCAWTSSDGAVASVDGAGVATAGVEGSATITCALDGETGSGALTVTAAELEALAVTPDAVVLFTGDSATLTATGSFSDGSTADVTATATWTSSGVAVMVTGAGAIDGVSDGAATITATVGAVSGTAMVTVSTARLTSIVITPTDPSVPAGRTVTYTATGTFEDGSVADITGSVTWTSSDTGAATIDGAGTATGVAVGTTTITAALDGQMASTSLTVDPPELIGVSVSPTSLALDAGMMGNLTATASFSDGSMADVTATATWMSSDVGVATVAAGVVDSVSAGMATISVSFLGGGATADVTVNPPTLTGLVFEAAGPFRIGIDASIQVRLIATFSDGSMADVTDMAGWSSSAPAIASVDTMGTADALTVGMATITATFSGMSASYVVDVFSAQLRNWSMDPTLVAKRPQIRNWDLAGPIQITRP